MNAQETNKRIGLCGIVPVVVMDKVENAIPTAKALLDGNVDVMEITLRTQAGLASIAEVAKNCPDTLVGAGTVINLEQCKQAVDAGAKFIVSPGFDNATVEWCVKNDISVLPGAVTPTEIMTALSYGLNVLKFFPANIYGGLTAMQGLAGPFGGIKFVPTGGISQKNLHEYTSSPIIHAVGGSWFCAKDDINAGNFSKITTMSKEATQTAVGFEFGHLGINCANADEGKKVANLFDDVFNTGVKEGNSSIFASSSLEIMKEKYLGDMGHIAIKTANMERGLAVLSKKGFEVDMGTAKYNGEKLIAVYLKQQFGNFAVHLLQK